MAGADSDFDDVDVDKLLGELGDDSDSGADDSCSSAGGRARRDSAVTNDSARRDSAVTDDSARRDSAVTNGSSRRDSAVTNDTVASDDDEDNEEDEESSDLDSVAAAAVLAARSPRAPVTEGEPAAPSRRSSRLSSRRASSQQSPQSLASSDDLDSGARARRDSAVTNVSARRDSAATNDSTRRDSAVTNDTVASQADDDDEDNDEDEESSDLDSVAAAAVLAARSPRAPVTEGEPAAASRRSSRLSSRRASSQQSAQAAASEPPPPPSQQTQPPAQQPEAQDTPKEMPFQPTQQTQPPAPLEQTQPQPLPSQPSHQTQPPEPIPAPPQELQQALPPEAQAALPAVTAQSPSQPLQPSTPPQEATSQVAPMQSTESPAQPSTQQQQREQQVTDGTGYQPEQGSGGNPSSAALPAEPTESAPAKGRRPAPFAPSSMAASRSSSTKSLLQAMATPVAAERADSAAESLESRDVTLLPAESPDSVTLRQELLRPFAAPLPPTSWAASSGRGLGSKNRQAVVLEDHDVPCSRTGAGGSPSRSRSASSSSEHDFLPASSTPPRSPNLGTAKPMGKCQQLPLLKRSLASLAASNAASSTARSTGSGRLSARGPRTNAAVTAAAGLTPRRCAAEQDGGDLWIPGQRDESVKSSENAAVDVAQQAPFSAASMGESTAAAIASTSMKAPLMPSSVDSFDLCEGDGPGSAPRLGGPSAFGSTTGELSALKRLASQQVPSSPARDTPPAARSLPRTSLAPSRKVVGRTSQTGRRKATMPQDRRDSRGSQPAPARDLLAPARLVGEVATPSRQQPSVQFPTPRCRLEYADVALEPKEPVQVNFAADDRSIDPCDVTFLQVEESPVPQVQSPSTAVAHEATIIGIACEDRVADKMHTENMPINLEAHAGKLSPGKAPAAATALGGLAEAKQKVLRLREQLGALSAQCDRLESAAGYFGSNAAAGSLGPAHAAAMKAAAEQLGAGPKAVSAEAVSAAPEVPSVEAIERMRSWVADIAGERASQQSKQQGAAPAGLPAIRPCAVSAGGCGPASPPDEGAGPVAVGRSPRALTENRPFATPALSSWWTEAVGNLWPEAASLFQAEDKTPTIHAFPQAGSGTFPMPRWGAAPAAAWG